MAASGVRRKFDDRKCPIEGCGHAMGLHKDGRCSICDGGEVVYEGDKFTLEYGPCREQLADDAGWSRPLSTFL